MDEWVNESLCSPAQSLSSNRGGNPCLGSLIVASGSSVGRRDAQGFAVIFK